MTASLAAPARATLPSRLSWTAFTLQEVVRGWRLPYAPAARIDALQARRVRAIVAHAYATVPFYRDAMNERGLVPGDIRSAADLSLLPLVTGAALAADPWRFRSTAVAHEPLLELTTSGTTGHAKRIWWDRAAVFRARAAGVHQRRIISEILGRSRGSRVLLVVRRGGTGDDVRAFHDAHSLLADPSASGIAAISPEDAFEHNRSIVNHLRPDVLMGFGSYVGALYRWAQRSGRAIHVPKLLWHGGEQLPDVDAELLAQRFGIAVRSSYQACEALRIAVECPPGGGLHVYADQVVVRIADDAGRTVAPGQRGQVVLSCLTNRATVLLNYAIGDVASMASEPCACGRTLPRLERLEGRADDLVRLPDGEVAHDSVLLSRLYAVPGVVRLQLVQETLDRFTIRVAHTAELDEATLRERLTSALRDALGGRDVRIDVAIADRLAPDASGKFRTVVSRVRDGATTVDSATR